MIKYHDKCNLQEEEFIWLRVSERLRIYHDEIDSRKHQACCEGQEDEIHIFKCKLKQRNELEVV